MQATLSILYSLAATLKKPQETDKNHVVIFYLTQLIQNIISTSNQYERTFMKYLTFSFFILNLWMRLSQ